MVVLLLHYLLMDLTVIEVAHLNSLVVLALTAVLILNSIFDHVIQRENVPCVVGLGLNLAFSSVLESRLCEVDRILFVCRT